MRLPSRSGKYGRKGKSGTVGVMVGSPEIGAVVGAATGKVGGGDTSPETTGPCHVAPAVSDALSVGAVVAVGGAGVRVSVGTTATAGSVFVGATVLVGIGGGVAVAATVGGISVGTTTACVAGIAVAVSVGVAVQ